MASSSRVPSPEPHPIFGAFEPVDVLIEYDAPLVFTFRDASGREGVAYLADAQPKKTVYLAAFVSKQVLGDLAAGRAPVLGAFRDRVWVIRVTEGGRVESAVERPAAAVANHLPPDSLTVYARESNS